MKGIVLCGGLGTRLNDLTAVTNKHLLPIYSKPMVYYPIEALTGAGIRDIMVVTGGNHAGDFIRVLKNGEQFGLRRLHYSYQIGEGGIADALSLAEEFVGDDKFVTVLGDNIFGDSLSEYIDAYNKQEKGAMVLLKNVSDPGRFGVAEVKDGMVINIVEKPKNPRTNLAVTGIYFFNSQVFKYIKEIKPSRRGELEITDVNNMYIKNSCLTYETLKDFWTDAGTFDSLLRAGNIIARRSV